MVSHDILLAILSHLMVSGESLEWFSSYLRERQQAVKHGDNSSNWRELKAGVPQGVCIVNATGSHAFIFEHSYLPTVTMEWNNKKVITFLEILQTEPCLWDPRLKNFKNRGTQKEAWRRIMELLPFKTSIEEIKKKKESLMGYYRFHLNRMKKSFKSGAGKDDGYKTNWFAFETMDNFLREVYNSSCTLNTEMTHDDTKAQSEERNYTETEEVLQNKVEDYVEIRSRPRENKSQNYNKKRQLTDELPQEIKAARRLLDEAFDLIKEKKDDEYEMFARLLVSKLKKIKNPNTRDILMNDIQNLVFRACMADRLEQQSAIPQFSTSMSSHQAFSPSTCQSPPNHSTSLHISTPTSIQSPTKSFDIPVTSTPLHIPVSTPSSFQSIDIPVTSTPLHIPISTPSSFQSIDIPVTSTPLHIPVSTPSSIQSIDIPVTSKPLHIPVSTP
ncbi:uncharacterized protein LOC111360189 [Spodoptera litura]|uniref:Uncharacterized protein LOC111360189 n=1 Tax=Spodoptera litura TaxID=69820 RepID=A0A9J7EP07_SPOLT|nr:uncharacterized protein LOC111360189 [Spodoptera litura]